MPFMPPTEIPTTPAGDTQDWFLRNLRKAFAKHADHGQNRQRVTFDGRTSYASSFDNFTSSEAAAAAVIRTANKDLERTGWIVTDWAIEDEYTTYKVREVKERISLYGLYGRGKKLGLEEGDQIELPNGMKAVYSGWELSIETGKMVKELYDVRQGQTAESKSPPTIANFNAQSNANHQYRRLVVYMEYVGRPSL